MRRCQGDACAMPVPEVATHCPGCAIKERRRRRRSTQRSEDESSIQTKILLRGRISDQKKWWRNHQTALPNLDNPTSKTRPNDE